MRFELTTSTDSLLTEQLDNKFVGRRRGHRGRDHMVVGFTTTCAISPITTKFVSSNLIHGKVTLIQYYVIKFVSDLRQVCGFLRFPPPIKLAATI
jgi:hypothetical protein